MLDSALELSYNLLKNLLLLPRILKLIGDMVNDSTPCNKRTTQNMFIAENGETQFFIRLCNFSTWLQIPWVKI